LHLFAALSSSHQHLKHAGGVGEKPVGLAAVPLDPCLDGIAQQHPGSTASSYGYEAPHTLPSAVRNTLSNALATASG
jgi:hypothetical protein